MILKKGKNVKTFLGSLQRNPYLLLVLATFFWGTNFAFSRMLVNEVPPFQLSLMRWIIASLVFLPFVYKELKENVHLIRKHWVALLFLSLTGIAGFNTILYIAIQYTTSINASLVNSTSPLLIVLLSVVFLKEKLLKLQYVGVVVSFFGVLTVITEGSLSTLLTLSINVGDVIVFISVICWSIYSVLMKKFGVHLPKKFTFIVTMYIGILVLIPFTLYERINEAVSLATLSTSSILGVMYLGIFPSIVSFVCWNEGVMQVGPGKASNYLHLIVLFTTILSLLFGGEVVKLPQFIGGVFILTGVVLASNPQYFQKKYKKRAS